MTQHSADSSTGLSRRRLLASVGTIGAAGALGGAGSMAFFSDQEEFANNRLVAGSFDLKVAYSAHYSDWSDDEGEGVEVRMWDGAPNTTGSASDLEAGETGLPTQEAWLIAVDDPEQFLANTQYAADGDASCPDGTDAEDLDLPLIDIEDVKPGDFGEVTLDLALCDNPGYLRLNATLESAAENGLTEPERKDPDEDGDADSTDPEDVELLDVAQAAVWADDGDNYQDDDESLATIGSLREVLTTLTNGGLGLNGDIPSEEGGGTGALNCFSAGSENSVAFAWWLPVDHGNEVQTDSVTFSLSIDAEQCRHNDGFAAEAPAAAARDVPILNYALTLEHLEYAFYRDGLAQFTDEQLMDADALEDFGDQVREQVPEYLDIVRDHEAAHVEALTQTIGDLGGDAVAEGTYDFGFDDPSFDPSTFFETAAALENTGVSAYAGAAPAIGNNDILAAAAGIHSVEARHASFLNLVNSDSPFPDVIDEARTMEEVLAIAGQFVTSPVDLAAFPAVDDTLDRKAENETSDLDVLNYALTLEHLEYAFYRDRTNTDNGAEVTDEALADAVSAAYGENVLESNVVDRLDTITAHEDSHVDTITSVIESLGGDPVGEANYDFGYENATEFLGTAAALENTGVSAYAGAAPTVQNDDIFAAAIGVHSVEARHAAFLNELNVETPFPDVVDDPRTMEEVLGIAGQFIVE